MINYKLLMKTAGSIMDKYGSRIAVATGIILVSGASVMTGFTTVKAVKQIEEVKKKKRGAGEAPTVTKKEAFTTVWKNYIPAAAMLAGGIGCIIASKRIDAKANAALAAAYTIVESQKNKYAELAKDLSDSDSTEVVNRIAEKDIQGTKMSDHYIIETGQGNVLCYDCVFGTWFRSSKNSIDKAVNTFNMRLRSEMSIPFNELFYDLNLPAIGAGAILGKNVDRGELNLSYSAELSAWNEPCLAFNYDFDNLRDMSHPYY